MERQQLVKAAIEHKETERVPYLIDFTSEAWEAIKERVDFLNPEEFLDNDVESFSPPWWTWHKLSEDWRGMDAPLSPATVIGTGSYTSFIESLKQRREKSDKYFLVRIYGSHFEKAYFSRGFENFLADLAGHWEFAKKLLDTIIEKNMVMLENILCLEEIDGVLLGSDWGSQRGLLMSPETWEELIRPGEEKEYDLVHAYGKDVWVHSCGCIEAIIPSLVEMGLDVLNPVQPEAMNIERLKKDYGNKLAFWGGISTQMTLPYGTPDEVREETRHIIKLMADGGGYILSPAQSIQDDVPLENILAMLEVAREYRET
jgi:uroporphyrinogen decarboxylase